MPNFEQKRKAESFLAMHTGGDVLLLPNVWDAASARIVEESGYPAIATTSAGIAAAQGFPDGQAINRDRMISVVAQIVQSVNVPVSADVEAGYGNKPEDAAQTTREVIAAGAIGLNLEDASGDRQHPLVELSLQLEKLRAVREIADKLRVQLVLNARTDVYLLQVGDPAQHYDETLRRVQAFRDAGADCVFVPGLKDAATIGRLVSDVHCPVNVLAGPGALSVSELKALGVRRISLGSGPMRASLGLMRRLAEEFKTEGTYSALDDAPSHAEVNVLMSSNRGSVIRSG